MSNDPDDIRADREADARERWREGVRAYYVPLRNAIGAKLNEALHDWADGPERCLEVDAWIGRWIYNMLFDPDCPLAELASALGLYPPMDAPHESSPDDTTSTKEGRTP